MDFFSVIGIANCVFALLFVIFFIWFMLRADADITLLFYEYFGRRPDFTGQVVWITGASSGIGEHLAYDFASCGAKLVLSGVNVEKLNAVKDNCLNKSSIQESDVLLLPFLIENFSVHEECVEKVLSHFGQINILINNAGVSQRADFVDVDIDVDQKLFNIDVFGPINLTRKVLKYFLKEKKGQIVVTSSLAGKLGAPFSSSYTGAKHALHGYYESLRTETIQTDINITIACPGPVFSRIRNRCFTGKAGEIFDEKCQPNANKMQTSRCSWLMTVAIANELSEPWMCLQPLLLLYYLSQYMPTIFKSVLLKIFYSRERIQAMRKGH